jgi:hypothetical protein
MVNKRHIGVALGALTAIALSNGARADEPYIPLLCKGFQHHITLTPKSLFLLARGDLTTNPWVSSWQLRPRATTLEHMVDLSVGCR